MNNYVLYSLFFDILGQDRASRSSNSVQQKRKREDSLHDGAGRTGRHGQPPRKRRRFNNVTFSIRRIYQNMADVTQDYTSDLRERCRSQTQAKKLQRVHDEKLHQLILACSEVMCCMGSTVECAKTITFIIIIIIVDACTI